MQPVLCYVDGPWAYFTTQKLSKQWGDDWDDAPYEHNAETPYEPHLPRDVDAAGNPLWEITKVAWDGPFIEPSDGHLNSPYTVRQINAGAIAWLRTAHMDKIVCIQAGVTLTEFVSKIESGGGKVYLPCGLHL